MDAKCFIRLGPGLAGEKYSNLFCRKCQQGRHVSVGRRHLAVEERHLGVVCRRIGHSTGPGDKVAGGPTLIRPHQRRRRQAPARRRRNVAVGRVLPPEHFLPLLPEPRLLQVAVAVAVRPEAGQRSPVRGDLVEAGLGRVDDAAEELSVGGRLVLE
jgi:hypothetical protein